MAFTGIKIFLFTHKIRMHNNREILYLIVDILYYNNFFTIFIL